MYGKLDGVGSEVAECLITMVDTCVLCEGSGNLVAVWAKDLPDGAVEHIVHQVDLPARNKQLLCLRLLLCQHKGQEQGDKNAGLHGVCLLSKNSLPPKILLPIRFDSQPIREWHQLSGSCRVISVVFHAAGCHPIQSNYASLSLVPH